MTETVPALKALSRNIFHYKRHSLKTVSLLWGALLLTQSCGGKSLRSTKVSGAETTASVYFSSSTPFLPLKQVRDEREELQRLIDEHAESGTPLKLPSGLHYISASLKIPSNLTIEGTGNSTEIFLMNSEVKGQNVFRIVKGSTNISFKNLKINANQQGNTGADLVAVFVPENVKKISFEKVCFAGGRDRGVVQVKGLNDQPVVGVRFVNCEFIEAGRTAVELRGTKDVEIKNCTFRNWGMFNADSPAIQLQSQDNIDVNISNNKFYNSFGRQFAIECAAAYVVNGKISNNQLLDQQNLGGNGISGYFKNTEISNNSLVGGNGNQRSGLEIFGINNRILNNCVSSGCIAIAPGLKEDGFNITITGNKIATKGENAAGIQIGNGKYNLRDVIIKNNIVDTRKAKGNSSAVVIGTYHLRRMVKDIVVEENTLYSNAFCIRMEALPGSSNIAIRKNICKAGMNWLGVITDSFDNVILEGNIKEMPNKEILYSIKMPSFTER
ncbi:right-handed parallel beta-helix repeat-containing protein [Pedobacter sp. SYSU D00535]|uniref:right-handed parallel beta-helix repeat-containing protein n=1 Tax=Pedobacter sp. SYSU D00535 TaxID=2810308 RepID=UPI001A97A0F8|nr:right-handed parallel beta-helix repeat-containing protein [Pedobacter sp. SYSU D00535]